MGLSKSRELSLEITTLKEGKHESVTFLKPDLPFLFRGNGSLTVNANVDSITQPLSASDQGCPESPVWRTEAEARISSMTLTSQVGGKDITKVFLSGGSQQADPAPVVAPTPVVPKGKAAGAPGGGN